MRFDSTSIFLAVIGLVSKLAVVFADDVQLNSHHSHNALKKSFCSLLPTCAGGDCSIEQQCRQGECKHPPTEENLKAYDVYDAGLTNIKAPYDFRIRSPFETMKQLLLLVTCEIPAIYLRFGDGDMNLANGKSDQYHEPDPDVQYWIKYALVQRGFNVIKAYPFMSKKYGYWEGIKPGTHLQDPDDLALVAPNVIKYFIGEPIYDSIALHHTAVHAPAIANRLIAEMKLHCPIFIGNMETPLTLRNALFGAGHTFIPTPPKNAWSTNKDVYTAAVAALSTTTTTTTSPAGEDNRGSKPYKVVVLSMGCAGRAMAAKLWSTAPNTFFFDFGSLMDYLSGNSTRQWIKDSESMLNVTAMIEKYENMPAGCSSSRSSSSSLINK